MGGEPHTLEDIGKYIGVSRERIRQILGNALEKLWQEEKET
jgi:DNA-directed RNA polymerase sigma subunit (sigma70/sigma32)